MNADVSIISHMINPARMLRPAFILVTALVTNMRSGRTSMKSHLYQKGIAPNGQKNTENAVTERKAVQIDKQRSLTIPNGANGTIGASTIPLNRSALAYRLAIDG